MATPKLHEIIAAEPNVTGVFNSMREETLKVFDKPDNFLRIVQEKKHFNEEDTRLDTSETKELVTTVKDRLNYLLNKSFSNYLDLQITKDATNQVAKADLVVGDTVVAKDVPGTMLLQLEKELKSIRELVLKAPTLQAGPVWVTDPNEPNLMVVEQPKVTFTTKKTMKPVILVQATDKFPAQVEKVNEDVAVAKIETKTWSGMLTSKEKAEILSRVDALLVAAKRARQRANSAEVVRTKIGKAVADFILSGPEEVNTAAVE